MPIFMLFLHIGLLCLPQKAGGRPLCSALLSGKTLSWDSFGGPTGAERVGASAASPEAVERSDQLDTGRQNTIRREEKDRAGMRIWRSWDEDRDEAGAERFGLNAELPSSFHVHENHGVFRDLGDAQCACALLLQIVVGWDL